MTKSSKPKVVLNWDDQSRKLKEKFSSLTDQDLYFEQGKMDEMIKRLQNKVGKTKHELYEIITRL
jgi:uncharacterized protein YjbJ (UPF0337 family)